MRGRDIGWLADWLAGRESFEGREEEEEEQEEEKEEEVSKSYHFTPLSHEVVPPLSLGRRAETEGRARRETAEEGKARRESWEGGRQAGRDRGRWQGQGSSGGY